MLTDSSGTIGSPKKKATVKTTRYDWSSLINRDINNKYTTTVRNKFNTLREISERHTPNDKYGKIVTTHMEAGAECMQNKTRARCRVRWESLKVRKKRVT